MKIITKYHIEAYIDAEEVTIVCETLEEAEKKLRNYHRNETEAYLIKTIETGKSSVERFLIV
jgi:hypothetical protein